MRALGQAAGFVEGAAHDAFSLWLNQHTELGGKIAQLAIERASARLKTEKQITRKKVTQGPALPGKLADCISQDLSRTELFLVEGDSAGGSARQARDKDFQAILPLRGKILNTWEVASGSVLASTEVHDLAVAIGCDPGKDDVSGLRYGKVIILADADSDGLHIATLLSALFLRHFPALVAAGNIFVAMPPLFRVDVGKQVFYALDEEEKRLLLMWDGTTQKGVEETMPKPRFAFRSVDNEAEAVMASILTARHFKGKIKTVAGINNDYSYGRDNWAAFLAIMKRFGLNVAPVAELWPKLGETNFTSHVATLQQAKPDLIFCSFWSGDAPILLKQAHAAGLTASTRLVMTTAGGVHEQLKKAFAPEGMILGYNSLYFEDPKASALSREFSRWHQEKFKEWPTYESDHGYFTVVGYKAAVEKLEQAVELEAGDPEINDHLGDAYWRVGRKDEAQFQWRRVLTLKPDDRIRDRANLKLASGLGPDGPAPKVAGN